jgi:segregation and condensation protein A
MTFTLKLENYQGPFDVLLELLNRRKLDITEVSLAKITNDYLDYITELELGLEEMNWFLFIATKLTYDKSQTILQIQIDENDIGLTESLKQYALVKKMAMTLSRLAKHPHYPRPNQKPTGPVKLCTKEEILKIYQKALKQYQSLPKSRTIRNQSKQLEQTRKQFVAHINRLKNFSKDEILNNAKTRIEAVLYLLTLLDMLKEGRVLISGESLVVREAT